MIENLTLWQKARIWLSELGFMERPLGFIDAVIDKAQALFSSISASFSSFFNSYGVFLRYILWLFTLTFGFIFLKILYKSFVGWQRASLGDFSEAMRFKFWDRYAEADEKQALAEVKDIFKEVKKNKVNPQKNNDMPIGFDLFCQVMNAINQGMSDSEIIKIVPSKFGLIDVAPMIEAIRSFRDLAARQILEPHSRNKRDYARALKELANGKPYRAAQLMKKELVIQQKILFNLKDRLLQQYARKEASVLALHLALILGVYDTNLADKAYRRSMELNPKNKQSMILFGRFRQRVFGNTDKAMEKTFLNMTKGIDKTLQNYMIDYAAEMIHKTQTRARLDELRLRYQDEKERYNAAVQIERLKIREALKIAKIKSIADEARMRMN